MDPCHHQYLTMGTSIPILVEMGERFNAKEKKLHAISKLKKEIIFNTVIYIDSNKIHSEKLKSLSKWKVKMVNKSVLPSSKMKWFY